MKRFFAALIACLLILPAAVSAHAENVEPVFYVEAPASAGVGDVVSIRVGVTGDFTASILNLQMSYDTKSFEYISHERGPVLDAVSMLGMAVCEHSAERELISTGILITADEGFSAQGVIFEASFKVLSTADKQPEFTLNVAEFDFMPIGQTIGTHIPCSAESAKVTISGAGTGAEVTAAPIHTPTVPQPTPAATPGSNDDPASTAAPNETQAAQTDGAEPASEGNETAAPVTDGTEKAPEGSGAASEDRSSDDEEGGRNELLTKALIIAGGCVLAAGLAALGVFFLKRARAAGKENKENKENKVN